MPAKCEDGGDRWRQFCKSMLDYREQEKKTHDPKVDFDTCYR